MISDMKSFERMSPYFKLSMIKSIGKYFYSYKTALIFYEILFPFQQSPDFFLKICLHFYSSKHYVYNRLLSVFIDSSNNFRRCENSTNFQSVFLEFQNSARGVNTS